MKFFSKTCHNFLFLSFVQRLLLLLVTFFLLFGYFRFAFNIVWRGAGCTRFAFGVHLYVCKDLEGRKWGKCLGEYNTGYGSLKGLKDYGSSYLRREAGCPRVLLNGSYPTPIPQSSPHIVYSSRREPRGLSLASPTFVTSRGFLRTNEKTPIT